MTSTSKLRRSARAFVSLGAMVSAGLAASVALAQQVASPATDEVLEEVVVTGSRIASPNATSSSPILAVSSEEMALQGIHDTGNLVYLLPQNMVTGSDLNNTNNPLASPGGVATADLRGLGPQRTLVLVDGRRLGTGDPNTGNPNPSPDLNQIPAALIERVDVVTGGASAVYGSDAIGGVVNFIMKRNFQGVQFDAQYGFNQHNQHNDYVQGLVRAKGYGLPDSSVTDGFNRSFSLLVGGNFADDRGNATAYFTFLDQDPTTLAQRDFSSCQLASKGKACSGSVNSNLWEIQETGDDFAVKGTDFIGYGSDTTSPPAVFNSNPYMNLLHGDTRYQAGIFAKFDWNDHIQLYTDFMFMRDQATTAVAPSGLFFGDNYSLNCNNPLLSTQQRGAIGCTAEMIANGDSVAMFIGRRNIEGGPRMFGYEHTNYRAVGGLRGDINDVWSYDVYGSVYWTSLYNTNSNYVSKARAQDAMNNCVSGAQGCVPWNILQEGGVTPEAAAYVSTYGVSNGTSEQKIVSGSVTGNLGKYGLQLPTANEGVGVAFGVEHRVDALSYLPDLNLGSGDLSGGSGASPTIDASTSVSELFAELRVPLVEGKTGAHDLVFETGYRYSDYDLSGGVSTYKFGLQWAPIADVRLRASFNRAIRAPSLLELYTPQTVTQTSDVSTDPCAPKDGDPPTATLDECMRTGVTPTQYNNGITQCPADQCATLVGGNAALKPETADTWSIGLTISPEALQNFTASVDWYQIKLSGIVSNVPLSVSLNGCLDNTHPEYCQNIVRMPTGGLFGQTIDGGGYIKGLNVNLAEGKFNGIDGQASYRLALGKYGSLVTTLNGSYMLENSTIPVPGSLSYDCTGLYGPTCGPALPKWRHTMRFTWGTPWNVQASLQWRYIGTAQLETNTSDPTLGNGKHVAFGDTLGSRSYFDLSGDWTFLERYSLRAGINNILDLDPPLVPTDTSGSGPGTPNTYGPYDTLGRQIFMAFTAKF